MAEKIKAMQLWCQKNTEGYKDVKIVNMTTSWRDGLAFCALIHRFKPELIDFDSLSKENVLHNNTLAFHTAENELGIAAVLNPEDMASSTVPDRLGVLTYISQLYDCLHELQVTDGSSLTQKKLSNIPQNQVETQQNTAKAEQVSSFSLLLTENVHSACHICERKVHLMERFIDKGHIYHRSCHRKKLLSEMYQKETPSFVDTDGNTKTAQKTSTEISVSLHEGVASPEKPNEIAGSLSSIAQSQSNENDVKSDSKTSFVGVGSQNDVSLAGSSEVIANEKVAPLKEASKTEDQLQENSVAETGERSIEHLTSSDLNNSKNNIETEANIEKSDVGSIICHSELDVDADRHKCNATAARNHLQHDLVVNENGEEELNPFASDAVNEDDNTQEINVVPSDISIKSLKVNNDFGLVADESLTAEDQSVSEVLSETCIPPSAKPRTIQATSNDSSTRMPKPKPRSSQVFQAVEDNSLIDDSTDEYDQNLNPFMDSDDASIHSKEERETVKPTESLNPFEVDDSNEDENNSYDDALNPFGSESSDGDGEDLASTLSKPVDVVAKSANSDKQGDGAALNKDQRGVSITRPDNTVSMSAECLNPFGSEFATKKRPAPKPPSRKKPAPAPPVPPNNTALMTTQKIGTSGAQSNAITNSPTPLDSSPSTRRKAPDWRMDVEKKMKEMNQTNQVDTKYVNKTLHNRECIEMPQISSPHKSPSLRLSTQSPTHKQSFKSSRPAPGFGFPLVKRRVKSHMTVEEIQREIAVLNIQLEKLENKGVKLEETLRDQTKPDTEEKNDNDFDDWFELAHEKNKLMQREAELVVLMQQQSLEQEHADVEFKIRKLLNKPDHEKTVKEREEESKLLDQLMKIVEQRNTIITSIEEDRVREDDDDVASQKLIQGETLNDSDLTKKKKKSKVKLFHKKKKPAKS